MTQTTEALQGFAKDIVTGLRQTPKRLPSKYFYNAEGDRLFQEIMKLDEYYLTRSEEQIIDTFKDEILKEFLGEDESFRLVELGAGDGSKTKILLEYFSNQQVSFIYSPIDISANVLVQLKESVNRELPKVNVQPIEGDYFEALAALKENHLQKEVVMFLGSTIGNFSRSAGEVFLSKLSENMSSGDLLFIGFDLMKDPRKILSAYDDSQGVTRDFNLNLLQRINDELGADFDLSKFVHYPTYDPITGETKSFLVSTEEQEVRLADVDMVFRFKAWEPIHTEISQKYSCEMISATAKATGFKVVRHFNHAEGLFVDSLWEKV
ncbi:L-histidine N(alpha)-methyltransferase [Roseivirga thermotolerans]|jgi:dimethylhistidine N-methyltransferase|uniref:Histidine N-alpha-methyltransferase n=1 Tax=Roseivirga thermotolerans TaxID=1758176 RepID=A0ABQ3I4W2_9BACT|nr:L-histidine N(alpha)-methyltransferase [Roseivirga thermotolerans]GHE64743.1 histidine N-alpha-methyltransferase [Roseivirga thermotolerans]